MRKNILTHPIFTSAVVALALTALLYGQTLALPLFSDDLVQIPWLESISWGELWTSPSPYGYYRPLWYSLWRVWGMLAGGLHPWGLHLLNLGAHFAASWLVGLLAVAWMAPKDAAKPRAHAHVPACVATAVFAAFPFARQAVAWPGAVYNPLVSAMAAGALLAYDRGRSHPRRGWGWIGLALLLAAAAGLTYEAGLLVGPLLALAEVLGWLQARFQQARWQRPRFWWPGPLACAALFAATTLVWQAMRGAGATGFGLNPGDLRRNIAFLAQGLIYPSAPLAQQVTARIGLDPELALWLVALPTLGLLGWCGLRRQRATALLGAGWFALFAMAPLVAMEADWFALAPRFLYMTAGGVALVWAAAASRWLEPNQTPGAPWRSVAATALAAALLLPAALFIRDGVQRYAMAGEAIWDAVTAAEQAQPLLLVNLPLRVTPSTRVYPLGFEGITPLPARVTAEGLIYTHTGLRDAATAVSFGTVAPQPPPAYTYELFGRPVSWDELATAARQSTTVYLTRYEPGRIHLAEAGGPVGDVATQPLARFDDRVMLLDASAACGTDGQVRLITTWRTEAHIDADVTVFAHLLDEQGNVAAQADGYPLLGMLPFWLWQPSEAWRDARVFDPVPTGDYTIRLGLWEPATGDRWATEEESDGTVLLPVRCP